MVIYLKDNRQLLKKEFGTEGSKHDKPKAGVVVVVVVVAAVVQKLKLAFPRKK